jgi:hypothetical protein
LLPMYPENFYITRRLSLRIGAPAILHNVLDQLLVLTGANTGAVAHLLYDQGTDLVCLAVGDDADPAAVQREGMLGSRP